MVAEAGVDGKAKVTIWTQTTVLCLQYLTHFTGWAMAGFLLVLLSHKVAFLGPKGH